MDFSKISMWKFMVQIYICIALMFSGLLWQVGAPAGNIAFLAVFGPPVAMTCYFFLPVLRGGKVDGTDWPFIGFLALPAIMIGISKAADLFGFNSAAVVLYDYRFNAWLVIIVAIAVVAVAAEVTAGIYYWYRRNFSTR